MLVSHGKPCEARSLGDFANVFVKIVFVMQIKGGIRDDKQSS